MDSTTAAAEETTPPSVPPSSSTTTTTTTSLGQDIDALLKRIKKIEKKCEKILDEGMDIDVYLRLRKATRNFLKLRDAAKAHLTDKDAPQLFDRKRLLNLARINTRPMVRRCKEELSYGESLYEEDRRRNKRVMEMLLPELEHNTDVIIPVTDSSSDDDDNDADAEEEKEATDEEEDGDDVPSQHRSDDDDDDDEGSPKVHTTENNGSLSFLEDTLDAACSWADLAFEMSMGDTAVIKECTLNRVQILAFALKLADEEEKRSYWHGLAGAVNELRSKRVIIDGEGYSKVDCLMVCLRLESTLSSSWFDVACALSGDETVSHSNQTYTKRQALFEALLRHLDDDEECMSGTGHIWNGLARCTKAEAGGEDGGDSTAGPGPVLVRGETYTHLDCALKAIELAELGGDDYHMNAAWVTLASFMTNDQLVTVPAAGVNMGEAFSRIEACQKMLSFGHNYAESWAMLALLLSEKDASHATATKTTSKDDTAATATATVLDAEYTWLECLQEAFNVDKTDCMCWAVAGRIIASGKVSYAAAIRPLVKKRSALQCFQKALNSDDAEFQMWHWAAEALAERNNNNITDDSGDVTIEVNGKQYTKSECAAEGDRLFEGERAGVCSDAEGLPTESLFDF